MSCWRGSITIQTTKIMELSEKLLSRGASSLSDKELLVLLMEDLPHVEECVTALFASYSDSLSAIMNVEVARLRMTQGIGLKRAQRVAVAAELGRRVAQSERTELHKITSNADVVNHFREKLSALPHEECWVLYLTSANSVIESQRLSTGGVGGTVVDHRLVAKRALELLATQIIMVHNHPSGSSEPSAEDVELTQRVKLALQLFDIRLLDHIIISRNSDYSFLGAQIL